MLICWLNACESLLKSKTSENSAFIRDQNITMNISVPQIVKFRFGNCLHIQRGPIKVCRDFPDLELPG